MIDLELSHLLWGLVAVICWFIRNELSKVNKELSRLDENVRRNTIEIEKIKTKLEVE